MKPLYKVALVASVLCLMASCKPAPTPTPLQPTIVIVPTATEVPATPTPKMWPTASTPAPEEPVIPVGYTATLQDTQHGVSGKAVMAGLQTIIFSEFNFDGQGPPADLRLVKEGNWDSAETILLKLERPYDKELLVMTIPSDLQPWQADSIAVYCSETKALYGWARFQ